MKIKSIRVYQHDLPIVGGPYVMSSGPLYQLDSTLVRLETSNGAVGWGETCPLGTTYAPAHADGARAALAVIAPRLLGADITRPRIVQRRMDEVLSGSAYAKAALDIAVFDALGQHENRSLADLLGGQVVNKVPSYYALNVGDPSDTARLAEIKVKEGYRRLQIKVGGRAVQEDVEAAQAVYATIGSRAKIVLDANRGLTTSQAVELSRSLRDLPVTIEQPCATYRECEQVRALLNHPMFLDESAENLATICEMIGKGVVDGFGMKITRLGGLQTMTAFRDLCEATNTPHTCDDSWGGDVIAAACIHMGATVKPSLLEGVWTALPYIQKRYDPKGNLDVVDGFLKVPSGPGLGLQIDPTQFGSPVAEYT